MGDIIHIDFEGRNIGKGSDELKLNKVEMAQALERTTEILRSVSQNKVYENKYEEVSRNIKDFSLKDLHAILMNAEPAEWETRPAYFKAVVERFNAFNLGERLRELLRQEKAVPPKKPKT